MANQIETGGGARGAGVSPWSQFFLVSKFLIQKGKIF